MSALRLTDCKAEYHLTFRRNYSIAILHVQVSFLLLNCKKESTASFRVLRKGLPQADRQQ